MNNKKLLTILGIMGVVLITLVLAFYPRYKKVNISGSGTVSQIFELIDAYGGDYMDFGHASCLTGPIVRNYDTKKYGQITIEFSYCALDNSDYIAHYYIHND